MRVFLAQPHYDGRLHHGAGAGFYLYPSKKYRVLRWQAGCSLLASSFNLPWAEALGRRDRGEATHFAMIHSDVKPGRWWLDVLMEELARLGADLVSAAIPIKSGAGLTSTAVGDPHDEWRPVRRLLVRELDALPETFDAADCGHPGCPLLVNTGLWVCDLRRDWTAGSWFEVRDRIRTEVAPGGEVSRHVETIPEDWGFSRRLWECGARVCATRKVRVLHAGAQDYPSDGGWGEWDHDREYETAEQAALRRGEPVHDEVA